jgi:hypothetical protein
LRQLHGRRRRGAAVDGGVTVYVDVTSVKPFDQLAFIP